jgi:hypothetical protein
VHAVTGHKPVVVRRTYVVLGRFQHVHPPPIRAYLAGTFKAGDEEALKKPRGGFNSWCGHGSRFSEDLKVTDAISN